MIFKIEQIAFCVPDPEAAMELLMEMGVSEFSKDHVVANGVVHGEMNCRNEADLAFEYDMLESAYELEILKYTEGKNWMQGKPPAVSHIGMHVDEEQLDYWNNFFTTRGYKIAQAVVTESHTNPYIAGQRRYQYVIFDTRHVLGVDVKLIRRLM